MSNDEIQKIISQASKHILPENYLDKLAEAAKRHGRAFKTHQAVCRIAKPSRALRKISKQSGVC